MCSWICLKWSLLVKEQANNVSSRKNERYRQLYSKKPCRRFFEKNIAYVLAERLVREIFELRGAHSRVEAAELVLRQLEID